VRPCGLIPLTREWRISILGPGRGLCGNMGATGMSEVEAEVTSSPSPSSEDKHKTNESSEFSLSLTASSSDDSEFPPINTRYGMGGRAEGSSFRDVEGRGGCCGAGHGAEAGWRAGRGLRVPPWRARPGDEKWRPRPRKVVPRRTGLGEEASRARPKETVPCRTGLGAGVL